MSTACTQRCFACAVPQVDRSGKWQVAKSQHRLRLDRFLRSSLSGCSQKALDKGARSGELWLNGKRISSLELFVKEGDKVEWKQPHTQPLDLDIDWPSRVLHEDESLLVINKPAGLASTPAPGQSTNVLAAVEQWLRSRESTLPTLYPVHRLDLATSGVLILVKSKVACDVLGRAFKTRAVKKCYHALVRGAAPEEAFTWHDALEVGKDGRAHVHPPSPEATGKSAKTSGVVVQRFGKLATHLELRPTTGRMHQLRAQAASRGMPILGDFVYGVADAVSGVAPPRLLLHCSAMEFPHPDDPEKVLSLHAPMPEDMTLCIARLSDAARK